MRRRVRAELTERKDYRSGADKTGLPDPGIPNDHRWEYARDRSWNQQDGAIRPVAMRDFLTGLQATSKATMCLEINRYANYVPVPKQMRCTPYQGFGDPKITGHRLQFVSDHAWNQRDGAVLADTTRRFSDGPATYEQSHDVL